MLFALDRMITEAFNDYVSLLSTDHHWLGTSIQ